MSVLIAATCSRPVALVIAAAGGGVTAVYSTLVSSAPSFTTAGSVTLTFTAKNGADQPVAGYTPTVEGSVV